MTEYSWRSLNADDLPALAALDAACREADGPASVPARSYEDLLNDPNVAMLCATADDGSIVAIGWAQDRGAQAQLGGKVHPAHRRKGLGSQLLRWAEERALTSSSVVTLIVRNEALSSGAVALYERENYQRDLLENWMQRDLSAPLPAAPDNGMTTVSWTEENAAQFFAVYRDSFATRPGFSEPEAEEWIAEYAEDPDFRPDLSLLGLIDGEPVGFVAAGEFPIADLGQTVGWISQVGVRPEWRGRGIAAGLLLPVMAAFKEGGFAAAGLHVNANNPEAIAAYNKLGFKVVGQRARYSKPLL